MFFDDYFDSIVDSVRETGYDAFLPSLCLLEGENNIMKVLDTDLSEDGDELLAKDWAATFLNEKTTAFLAYRSGDCTVIVLELSGYDPIRKRKIIMNPVS